MIHFSILSLLIAFGLDLLAGDPRWLPHPVRWMGKGIETLEPRFRRLPVPPVWRGGALTILLVGMVYLLSWGLICIAFIINPLLELAISIILIFYCISARSLYESAQLVLGDVRRGDLSGARKRVGCIVGRDTDCLDAAGVRLATIETVAENFVDGVAAPLFFAAIGGAPLAMAITSRRIAISSNCFCT